jgi:hypothetical protein
VRGYSLPVVMGTRSPGWSGTSEFVGAEGPDAEFVVAEGGDTWMLGTASIVAGELCL